ncbi:hypothetical protein TYRP_001802 [Tyrophagus putrescentiae]|nr:hypothetical protein TYRP_001802 [Tyrophagus putrescentiae]
MPPIGELLNTADRIVFDHVAIIGTRTCERSEQGPRRRKLTVVKLRSRERSERGPRRRKLTVVKSRQRLTANNSNVLTGQVTSEIDEQKYPQFKNPFQEFQKKHRKGEDLGRMIYATTFKSNFMEKHVPKRLLELNGPRELKKKECNTARSDVTWASVNVRLLGPACFARDTRGTDVGKLASHCTAQGGEVWHLLATLNFRCLGPRERSERGPRRRKFKVAKRCRVSRR